MATPQLLTIGRVSVDLYAEQVGVPMTDVTTFRKSVGGTSTNVAVAAARLGHHAATVTKVGDDQFGRYITHALEHTFGVDTRWVTIDPELPTPLAFAELLRFGSPAERVVGEGSSFAGSTVISHTLRSPSVMRGTGRSAGRMSASTSTRVGSV